MRANRKPANRKPAAQWSQITKAVKASQSDDDAPRSASQLKALKRLGVSVEALDAAPRITPLLKHADGGMKTVFSAMRLAPDATIASFLQTYDSVSARDRSVLPMEAVAIAAGLSVTALLGAIMFALQAQAVNIVKIMAMTAHPKIVAARLKYGLLPSGERDRSAMDTAMGFLPNPKGAVFVNKAIYNSGKAVMDEQRRLSGPEDDGDEDEPEIPLAAESDIDLDALFPPASRMQEEVALIRNRLAANTDPEPSPAPEPDRIAKLFRNLPKQVN